MENNTVILILKFSPNNVRFLNHSKMGRCVGIVHMCDKVDTQPALNVDMSVVAPTTFTTNFVLDQSEFC
jgi:hypothetical protein